MASQYRSAVVATLGVLALTLAACGGGSRPGDTPPTTAPAANAPAASAPTAVPAPQRVSLGVLGGSTDAGFFIGLDQGFFQEYGIEVETQPFDSAARMVVPLGAGQLDAGGGSHSAGLFNAVGRDVSIKLVADKGSLLPGHGFQGLMFRRDLVDSGRLRTPADLRGMSVAVPARGITTEVSLAAWLRQAGLTLDDVDVTEMNFADHATALGGRAIGAAVSIEPFLTRILDLELATLYQRTDELIPGYQVAEVIYSGRFASERPDAALRFMMGYLRAVRYYNDAFVRGDAAKRQQAVATLARHTTVKDIPLYDRMVMPGLHPDGKMNRATIASDQDFWLSIGLQRAPTHLDDIVDHSFADAAARALGPYR
jgi:NitT/TauT family transport system substrate-binding protein